MRDDVLACYFGLVLLSSSASVSQGDSDQVHAITMRGIDHLYNLDMERALGAFDSVTALDPGDPRGPFFRSMVYFWIYTLKNSEADYERFVILSDTVITICESLADSDPDDAVSRFYLGGIHGYRGLAHQLNGSIFKAVMEGRSGYLSLEEAVHLKPDLPDAHMGFGLYRYLVAKVPRGFSWVPSLLGFEGDLKGGIESLRYAADRGVYTRSEANFFLSQFLRREGEGEEAYRRMNYLIERHSENTLFFVMLANWQFRDNHFDDALQTLDRASEINERKGIRYGEEFIYSTRATIAYQRNDFASAAKDFDNFLKKTTLYSRIPNRTYYRIAAARDITGDRAGAVEACLLMQNADDSFQGPYGSYLMRKGRELAAAPLTESEIGLIKADNARDRDDADSASYWFGQVLTDGGAGPDVRAVALYGMQEILFDRRDDAGVISLGGEIALLKPERESWVLPHSQLLNARSHSRIGQTDSASRALDLAGEFDGYDFQESLERRIEEERERIDVADG